MVLIGRSTRLSRYVTGLDKSYTATARFGAVSDTLDAEGNVTELDARAPDEASIRAALDGFTGDVLQIPPMASAVKVGGVRLYDLHRRGATVEREPRPVTIHSLSLANYDPHDKIATFEVSCSSGTYVRTLISDLASSLESGAYLTALRRTRVGTLRVEDAIPTEQLEQLSPDTFDNRIIQPRRVVSHLPVMEVEGDVERAVRSGRVLEASAFSGRGSVRVEAGEDLLAVYRVEDKVARAEVVLCGGP